jgi:hypothetical protein
MATTTTIPEHDHHDDVEAHYSGLERPESPHACYEGVVFIGEMVDDYMGGEVEIFWPYPCRRCSESR